MDLQRATDIIKDYLDESNEIHFQYDKILSNGFFSVHKTDTENEYSLEFNTYDYSNINNQKVIFNSSIKNLNDILNSIINMTKEEIIYYCKINDLIYTNYTDFEKRSKLDYACLYITNLIEECCVCKDHNTVKTSCQHNLCRLCFRRCEKKMYCLSCESHINYICCPLCRLTLKADCSHFFVY